MAKADVLQLVADLSDSLADQTAAGKFYDDAVLAMGLKPNESLVGASVQQVTAGTAQYSYPATAIRLLSLHYDTRALQPSETEEAQAYDKQWRSTRGEPLVWLVEQESRRTYTLVPVPRRAGTAVDGFTPFSATFPEGNVTAIYTENRTDVHPWEELYVALRICVKEFERDSDHTDKLVAQAFRQLADAFGGLLGLQ